MNPQHVPHSCKHIIIWRQKKPTLMSVVAPNPEFHNRYLEFNLKTITEGDVGRDEGISSRVGLCASQLRVCAGVDTIINTRRQTL